MRHKVVMEAKIVMAAKEVMETEEVMEDEDEEEDKLYAITVINQDICPGIARTLVRHVGTVMRLVVSLKIVLNYWLRCRRKYKQ